MILGSFEPPVKPRLSSHDVPVNERLIFALDVPSPEDALRLVDDLGDAVHFYKMGLELFMAGDYFAVLDRLVASGVKVFVDLKFFDVPETVAAAVRRLRERGATFATVHGNDAMLEAAAREKGDLGILAVTALTSLDQGDLRDLGFSIDLEKLVLSRARRALELGCDGVISSGLEVRALRETHGDALLIVSPGIRPLVNRSVDDQKRVATVEEAFAAGADYIVVGRPIRKAPDPRAAAAAIQETIARLFG
jgi:orotidine-5'-phosphate decarboxylase